MDNMYNVVALNAMRTAIVTPATTTTTTAIQTPGRRPDGRMTRAFRNLLNAPADAAELALLRLIVADVEIGMMPGCVTWRVDNICKTILIQHWPSGRIIDAAPFPVDKLGPESRALRFAARIADGIATLGIADDPDPAMKDHDGRTVGSRIGVFP